MKIPYTEYNFLNSTIAVINNANAIIAEYQEGGYRLTLRQLYYQFVARDLIENTQKSYKRIGTIVNKARLAGLISWEAIEDRTRCLESQAHWNDPKDIIEGAAKQYQLDKWANQEYRPEVWVEKEALIGVVANVCESLDVPYFACRGYVSQSEQWAAGQRFIEYRKCGQEPIVFHLGDHDPSGMDMTRDNSDRLGLFAGLSVPVVRLALNYDQVEEFNLPPNPAKTTDSRIMGYKRKYGIRSWELDALEPNVISGLIQTAILGVIDEKCWNDTIAKEEAGRLVLKKMARNVA